jgi:hypothetical protein
MSAFAVGKLMEKEMRSEAYRSNSVIARFALRTVILLAFAAFAGIGFEKSLAALLWMSTIICTIFAAVRRERPLADGLNHWDEATAYLAICCLLTSMNHTAAV